jgi:poly(3-hydroxybutyrate) depolymerase
MFYEEYMAVSDLTADFYLETVRCVFQDYSLPQGELTVRGRRIDLAAIRRTALLTIEGERDDICSVGQTLRRRTSAPGCVLTCATTTCRPVSATTASSAASAGRTTSTRSCAT